MIRLAVIGAMQGAAAYASIAPRLRRAELVAAVETAPGEAQTMSELLGQRTVDAVVVHESCAGVKQAIGAANEGKHVLVEVAPGCSVTEMDALMATCAEQGVTLMVGAAARFVPAHQAVHGALQSGRLGEPGLLRIHRWDAEKGDTSPRSRPLDRLLGEIDLSHWLFGAMPTEVFAITGGGSTPADCVQLHFGFPGGGMALIDAAVMPGASGYSSLSLIGSTGAAYADDHHNMQLLFGNDGPAAVKTGQGHLHLLAMLQEFVDAIEQRREPAVTGGDGRAVLQVAEAAAESIASGRAARWAGGGYELL